MRLRQELESGFLDVGRGVAREDEERVERGLRRLRACEDLAELPTPKSARARLRKAVRALRESCVATRAGADVTAGELLDDERTFRSSLEHWVRASAAFARANSSFPRPLSRQHLPVPSAGLSADFTRHEPTLSRIAEDLLHLSVHVRCLSETDWSASLRELELESGVVGLNIDFYVLLAPEICDDLERLIYANERPATGDGVLYMSDSVGVFAHELRHLREGTNEAAVECAAVQRVSETAVALGVKPAYAELLSRTYWEDVYPALAAEYRTASCREDGPLDSTPGDGDWP